MSIERDVIGVLDLRMVIVTKRQNNPKIVQQKNAVIKELNFGWFVILWKHNQLLKKSLV
jgi:hypothetical protein